MTDQDAILASLPDKHIERFARHLVMPQIGPSGQRSLLDAHVAIVGVGGIGCPVAQYLAAAGVGTLSLFDDDIVSTSNLSRQILFGTADVGRPKVEAAQAALARQSPDCAVMTNQSRVGADTSLNKFDLIIDGTDTYTSRVQVSSCAHRHQIPLLSASILGTDGQLAIFGRAPKRRYDQLFPADPGAGDCASVGVLSPAAGMVGTMAASLAVQLLVQINADDMDGKCALVGCFPPSIYWLT